MVNSIVQDIPEKIKCLCCPECQHGHSILAESLSRSGPRRTAALDIITGCRTCQEYFGINGQGHRKGVVKDGYYATLRRAIKTHDCFISRQQILPGQEYYSIVAANSGIAGRKYPMRVLPEYLGAFFESREEAADA